MVAPSAGQHVVDMVEIRIRHWADEFLESLAALAQKTGKPLCSLAVSENRQVPRNSVLCYMDVQQFGRVNLLCHPLDREAVESRLQDTDGMRLADLEPIPGAKPHDG